MKNNYNVRSIAAKIIGQVLDQKLSLSALLPIAQKNISDKDKALLQELCFGALRTLPQLEWCVQQLMARPMTGKQRTLHYLLLIGIYQLVYTRIPPHAALAETVEGATALKRPQLKGLINGVLRQFQRQQNELLERSQNNDCHYLHPEWLIERIRKAYPKQWSTIIDSNNQKPPMWLRVNRNHHSRDAYQILLEEKGIKSETHNEFPDALRLLEPSPVNNLPGFDKGWVTVQDASAQGCVPLLAPQNEEHILDLCAAPGGKTTYILEIAPKANVLAVDIDEERLSRVQENLKRLQQHAEIKCGDGLQPDSWCSGRQFDRILLDAPCSATGVIRRHPDIKWLRRNSDIAELAKIQAGILDAIWPYLKSGGTLVYATCSVLPEENEQQISKFIAKYADAKLTSDMRQHLPSPESGDGFFYVSLMKQ